MSDQAELISSYKRLEYRVESRLLDYPVATNLLLVDGWGESASGWLQKRLMCGGALRCFDSLASY